MPFNYTEALHEVMQDICITLPQLAHVDLSRVAVTFRSARQASTHGTYAACHPLRFEGGALEMVWQGQRYRKQQMTVRGQEMLYMLSFMLPRFHTEQGFHGRIATIIHELYHISPRFDGDLRRLQGRSVSHGHSREQYHAAMEGLADRYLDLSPRAQQFEFLRLSLEEVQVRFGGLVGARSVTPKTYPFHSDAPLPPPPVLPPPEPPPVFPRLRPPEPSQAQPGVGVLPPQQGRAPWPPVWQPPPVPGRRSTPPAPPPPVRPPARPTLPGLKETPPPPAPAAPGTEGQTAGEKAGKRREKKRHRGGRRR